MKKELKKFKSELKQISDSLGFNIIVASKSGLKYHREGCIVVKNIPKNNIVVFKNKKIALEKGLKPCSVCFK